MSACGRLVCICQTLLLGVFSRIFHQPLFHHTGGLLPRATVSVVPANRAFTSA